MVDMGFIALANGALCNIWVMLMHTTLGFVSMSFFRVLLFCLAALAREKKQLRGFPTAKMGKRYWKPSGSIYLFSLQQDARPLQLSYYFFFVGFRVSI